MTRFLTSSCVMLLGFVAIQPQLAAQGKQPSVRQLYGRGVTAYFTKVYKEGYTLLTQAIERGTKDPRTHYFRGLCSWKMNDPKAAKTDFENGANLEFLSRSKVDVPRALEKVQGAVRQELEAIRREFRRQAASRKPVSGKARVAQTHYAQGVRAYFDGNYKKAHAELTKSVTAGSKDPRTYYFRAFSSIQLGKSDAATTDFVEGAKLETVALNGQSVDRAIERIQGTSRAKLEKHRVQVRIVAMEAAKAAAAAATPDTVATTTKPEPTVAKTDTTPAKTEPTKPKTPTKTVQTQPAAADGKINSTHLPADSELFVVLRPSELWDAAFLKPILQKDEVKQSIAMMQQMVGLGPADVDTITMGIGGISEKIAEGPAALAGGPPGLPPGANLAAEAIEQFAIVIRTKQPYNRDQITAAAEAAGGKPVDHNGTTIYNMQPPNTDDDKEGGFYFAGSREIVLGDMDSLKAAIDTDQAQPIAGLEFVDAKQHLLIIYRPKDGAPFKIDEAAPEGTPPSVVKLFNAANGKLDAFAFGIFLNDNINLKFMFNCTDSNDAKAIATAANNAIDEGKTLFELAKGQIPPAFAQIAEDSVKSVKARAIRTRFQVIATIPGEITDAVAQAGPQLLMPLMMMAGGFSGGTGSGIPGATTEPPKSDGTAEGLAFTATARKMKIMTFVDGKQADVEQIEVALDAVGKEAATASSFGFLEIKSATDTEGDDLKLTKQGFWDPATSFVEIQRGEFSNNPDNGARLRFKFDVSKGANDRIATLDGVVKLRSIGAKQEIVVDKIASFDGKDLDNAELKAAGYQFKVSKKKEKFGDLEVQTLRIELVSGPANTPKAKVVQQLSAPGGAGLQPPELLGADDMPIDGSGVARESIGDSFAYTVNLQEDLPADAKLKFVINKDVTVVDAPFSLKDIEIKAAP